jgi:hypothetical protein
LSGACFHKLPKDILFLEKGEPSSESPSTTVDSAWQKTGKLSWSRGPLLTLGIKT